MRIKVFCLIALFISEVVIAQDTLYINISDAVRIALNKYQPLEIDASQTGSTLNLSLPTTEFNFKYGELYSPEKGWNLEIKQDFGPVFGYSAMTKSSNALQNLELSKIGLEKKQLEVSVKSTYLQWIYYYNKLQNIDIKREYLEKYLDVANLKFDLGETSQLDKLKIETKISEIETAFINCLYDIELAEINLQKFMLCDNILLPENKTLEMYMIKKQSDTSEYSGSCYTDIYLNIYKYSQAETQTLKTGYYPTFNAGVFYQDIGFNKKMTGITAGIKVPLWYFPQKSVIKKASIETERNKLKYEQSQKKANLEIESLKLKLDKCFITIRHFQNHAIPLANNKISSSILKYQHEEIEFEEYINEILDAMETKSEYLDYINEYNQTALQLELYSK